MHSSTTVTTDASGSTVTEVVWWTRTRAAGLRHYTSTSTIYGGTIGDGPNVLSSPTIIQQPSPLATITTTNSAGKTVVEALYTSGSATVDDSARSRTSIISTILSDNSNDKPNYGSGPGSGGISAGAKAGIGVGIGVAIVVIIGILGFAFARRRKRGKMPRVAGIETNRSEKREDISREPSTEDHVLPTWKSELSGEPTRAELDANNENRRAELTGARSPTELDAAGFSTGKNPEDFEGEHRTESLVDTQEKAEANLLSPPPIPYASKPKPS